MIDITRLKQVYATLQKGGYSQDFGTFRKGFAGNENYANRKKVYDLLSANGAQIGKTYEEFMQNMQKPKSMGNPTVNKYRQQMFNSVDPTKNKASELTRKAVKTAHKAMDNVRKPVRGAVVNKQGKKVKEFDITPAKTIDDLNREYAQEVTSDWEKEQQRQSLYNTNRSLDEVQRKIAERDAQLDEADNGFWTGIRHAAQGMNVTGGIFQQYDDDMRKELIDPKYKQYLVEANYLTQMKKQLIQEEEDAAAPNATKWDKFKHASSSFTSGMLDEAFGSDAFDFGGYNKMRESDVLLRINDRINRGVATDDDRRLLQILKDKEEVESRLDNDAYSFGRGASQSAGFVTDFLITGGGDFGGLGRLGGKMALGLARKTFAKTMTKDLGKRFAAWSLKNLGKTLGEATGAAMTATSVQVGKTAANATQRYLGLDSDDGGLEYDKEGNLRFKGGTDVGTAIAKAVASGTIENYTELLGPHITSMGKRLFGWAGVGLEKITPDALSRFFDKVGSSELFKRIGTFTDEIANSKVLNAGKKSLAKVGVNDMPEEGLEEEAGIILNSLITGDNKFSDLWDKETQYKTWGGVMSMMGAMRAIPIARSAVGTAYSASKNKVEYFKCKHDLTKAETLARQALGDKWTPIKELIDNADNKHIIEVGVNIIRQSDKYSQEQAKAAQMYIGQLLKMRGFNNATMASIRDKNAKGEELTDADKKDIEVSNAYAEGHETEGELRHLIQLEYEKRTANLAKRLGLTPEKIDAMNVDSFSSYIGLNSDADFDIFHYKKAKAAYDGVMDNAQNLVDIAGEVAAHRVDNMTNVHDGTIRKAFKKGTESNPDSPVYIISGNIELNDDVSINYTDSDKMIVVYDEETGQREAIGIFMLASVDPNIQNAEEVKAQAIQEAKQKIITEQSNVIDGILAEGSEFTMESNDGISHNYKIVQVDEQGNCIVSVDGTVLPEPLSLDAIQRQYDQSNIARSVKNDQTVQESEQTTQEPEQIQQEYQPIEDKFDYAKITNVNDGKVKSVVVTDEEGNNRFPNAKAVFLIQDKGAMPKFVVMDEEGNLTSYVGKRGDKIRLMGEKTVGEYKKQRQEELQMIAAENANSSMIEDNSGTIEGDRGEIEVEDNTQPLSEADADNVIAQMESSAETAPELELTPDNWVVEFGEDGIVSTPIGDVKMGENQVAKLFEKGRSKEFGMIKPTLTNPDVIIEVPSHSADGNEERSSSYLFIKTFLGKNGEKVYYFKSVTIKKDGLEISISSHYDRAKRVKEALMEGKLLYRKNDGAQTEQNQPSASVTTSQEDAAGSSENKDTNISANGNENNESLTFEDGTPIPVDANGDTDLSQTDASHAAEWYDNNLGEDADDWLDGEIKKVKKVLEQAKNKKLTGTKPSELVASKKEKEAAIADAQAHYDSAISIRDSLKERRIAKEENTADGRKNLIEKARRKFSRLKSAVKDDAEAVSQLYKDVVGSLLHRLYDGTGIDVTDTIPLTAEEYVASNLGAHSLNYEGTETSKGVKQETGLSREDFAKTQLLAADGKGTTIDDLVHSLWENRPSNLESLDTQDIRNALIGVLNSGFKASEARNYIENLRIAQAENILEEQKKAAANAAFAEENKAESEQQTETAPESEKKTGEDNSDEINDEENEQTNAPEQNKFPDKLRDGSKAIEVPEDATDENPLGEQRTDSPFSARKNGKQQTEAERAADVEKNKVDDIGLVDAVIGEKIRKSFERIAKMMGAKIQYQRTDKLGNGWIQESKDADGNVHRTIFITLDSSITEGAQFIFGHEMTHQIKNLNPAAYNELTQLVLDTYGSDAFDKAIDETMKRYSDAGFSGRARDYYAEEVVADAVGEMIRDLNLAHTLAMKMSHPLLAAIHEILQKIKLAFYGTEYSDVTKNIIRSIEQAYVKTANGQVTNTETGEDVSFSLRQKPEPKKKGIGYKVFVLKDGKLYPPMVANPDGAATPVGVWLDADAAPIAGESKTGRPQVKQGGKGTQGGSGKLAYRPGWHLGVVPYAIQFNRKDAEGNKTLFPKNFVFAEVEYAADVDYQEEARQEGINPSGKYQHSLAGLKHLPTDGYYMYRTNPNPETDPWVITGAMKVNRILTRAEQAELVKNAGREPQQIQEGDIVTDDVVNSINQEIADAPKFSLKVYHGSGADFTEFDFDHMGEGAGSQAFGWGGYVTSSKKIGKSYAEVGQQSAESRHAYSEDTPIEAAVGSILGQDMYNKQAKTFEEKKAQAIKNAENSIVSFSDMLKNSNELDEKGKKFLQKSIEKDKKELEVLRTLTEEQYKEEYIKQGRAKNLYEVDIPEDNGSNYIEFYEDATPEFKEQIKSVLANGLPSELKEIPEYKEAERKFYEENGTDESFEKSLIDDALFELERRKSNGDAYNALSVAVGDKLASKILSSLGYTGIKYPAGTIQGGAEEGDTNYVIFKPEDMRITEHTKFSLRLKSAIEETETNPSDAQKESGNYKKGHIKFGGYDYTIENPKGSTRSGKDADGKEWKVTMHDTYGYIRGKFGKDGDHLDMFINDKADLDNWDGDVFVVDQVNPDGSFDEHKVMYGYDSMDDAKKAYLANYSKGWKGLGNIAGASKDEFDKWLDTSKRKLKPFADYAKVKFSLKDIKPVGVGAFGNIYNQFRGNAKAAIEFLKKVRGGEAVGALHHKEIGDIDLVWGKEGTGHSDGYGLSKLVKYHPEVLDNLQEILNDMRVVSSSKNRVNLESETHKAGVRLTWDGERKSWLLTAFKKETSASDKRTDTAATSLEGDTALSQTEGSAAKIDNSSETAKKNGEKVDNEGTKFSLKDEEYLKAVEDGNMEKAQKMVNEAAEAAGYSTDSSYQGTSAFNGAAPWGNGYFLTKEERKEAWDNDEYDGDQTLGDYIHRGIDAMNLDFIALDPRNYRAADPMRKEAIDNVRNAIQKKSETITMYRSVPSDVKEGSFRNGDWVTPSRAYAVDNAKVHGWGDNFNIIEQKVPVDEIWWDGNDIAEWGYGREEDYINDTDFAYKNSKNNKKLLDAVTYDDNGNVIPLSQRFNEKNKDVRFSLKDEKTMFGMHNISIDKLRKAIKQGGFAAPSMGVVDSKNGIYSGYGEITLIPKAEKIAKRTGKNIGTYAADAWTPIYPPVEKKFGGNGGDVAYDDIESVPKEMQRLTRNAINSFMDGREANGLAYLYLQEKGKAPELVHVEGKYPKELHDEVKGILGKLNGIYNTTDEQKEKLLDLLIREVYDGNKEEFDNDIKKLIKKDEEFIKKRPNSNIAKNKQLDVDWMKEHGYDYGALSRFVDGILRDAETSGKVDENATMKAAQQYIQDKGMKEDFDSWKEKLNDRYNVEEVIFAGYKPDGNRKYLPNTVENAVKVMKQDGKNASVGSASFSHFVASILKPMGTLDQIRKKKGNLTGNYEDVEKFQEKWQPVYDELADKMQPDAEPFESYGMDRLEEVATQKNPKKYAKEEYGVDLTDEDINKLNELIEAVKNDKPSIYFETKFMRPYGLDEFEKAIVPNDTPSDVVDALKMAGIDVSSYERGNAEDRQKVTMDAINSSDNIRFSLKSMMAKPEGWKQANKKAIHIAEAIERDPKFSLKNLDGTLIKAGTYFSGGGLVEEGLKGIIDPVVAVEYDEKISGVYRNNFGQHIVTADVRDVDPKELVKQIDGEVEYFHASPVCKNYSQAKSNHAEVELDKETAASTSEFINAVKPKVVTIENVKGYKDSEAMKTITDALDANGYTWDADVYNAADYGGYTNRERLIVRAVRDGKLPEKPKKMARKSGWYEAVADIIPTLTEKKNGVAPWMDIRLKADGIDWRNIDKPLYVMGSAYADGKIPHAFADELLPTLRTKSGDVIVMPDGKVYRAMGRVLARVSGVSDDYKMPFSENLSHTIIGNGIPTQLTEHVIAPLLTGSDPKFSIRTYHGTGAKFDKFDFSHMGEGEGSQAFGWGGYVTNSKDIAEDYTRRAKIRKDNGGFEFVTDMSANNKDMVRQYIYKHKDVNKGLDAMRKDLSSALEMFPDDDDLKELSNILAKKNEEIAVPDNIAYLYDVDIPDDNGDYLDWDAPLTDKQKNTIIKELRRLKIDFDDFKKRGFSFDGSFGGNAYDFLMYALRRTKKWKDVDASRAVSKFLSSIGFTGIKYKAGTIFGGAKEGDYNYVIFDENNANIVGNTRFSLRGSTPYGKQMEEWMEKNHLEKGAVPMEKPVMKEGENIFDYANRMVEWTRNQNLWKTAPKQTGFQDALDKWKADNGLSPDAYPPVRPHRENYSTEIGYTEDLEEYNKKKELWKSAPKPKDFDLSVDLEDMNKQLRNIRRAVLNQKNYDQRTVKAVSDLVRKMLNIGWGDGLSRGKVGNLLSAAKNATGANDVKKYLDKAMGILAENYLNRLSTAYDNLINTKGARADQSGVIKMGSLDANGQAFMSEYKKAINMDDKSLNNYVANIEEDSAKNEDNVEMNDYRLAGIQAAIMYKQQIGGNDADISELKRQIGELKNKKDATKEDKDLLKSLEKKLFENKFDRITMYENLLNNIQRMVKESKGRAKEFREEIAEHKNEILHRANLDLEGVVSTYYDTTTAKKKFVNNDLQRAVFSSTYTFEQFLKFFGKHSANGEGRLYNYFHKLNQDALDEEQLYNEMNRNALDEKTKELFGKKKFMKLVGIDGKGMKEMDVEVTDYSNKENGKRTIHLKQGQMLYIYLVNKETDGEMKLRAMGITEEDVAAIEENLDPRVKAMGEWLQDEYLPECQRRYQATHTKYFGAPMKEVENYFPLAINNRARNVKEDVNQDSDAMSQLAGTSTGAIVTRRVNVIPLDIENADAFEVAFNHLQEMEEWSAMLPFRQDINTLLSYTHFRNQVQNMSSVAYGSGKTLWDEFKQTAQIAAGTYKPKVNAGMMDSRIAAAMGGIAVAKISGRLWTAIKQSQSATVFLPECDFTRFVKNGVNPYGSWKWAMENIPDFRKRVENMTYGDVKLRQYLDELEKWHDWTKTISKIGMAPNILVDGITCAVGARSVYETEVNRLTKLGYPKEKAEEKAYYKAVAAYNKTQQSSGGMYLSPMQVDRTYVSAALSLFKNANYAYGRMQIEACRGLARTYDFWGGKHKTTLIESMTRQIMEEDGLDENTARAIAKATYNRTFRQSIGRLINFATLVPVSWALYKVLPYLLTGDDDDKKNDMIEEAVLKGFATSLSDNYVIPFASNILNAGLKVEDGKPTFDPEVFRYQNLYINPATSDLANIYSMVGNQKWYSVANKLGMLGVQSLIGFNPETVGALYQALSEADYDNGNTAKEWQIGILKAISAPEESIRELYMDELGLKSGDIKKIPLAELEKRYAERQINRDNLLSQIGMDAEDFNGYVEKYQKSFEKKIKDKMDKWDEYDKKKADEFFDTTSDPKLKDMIEKKRAKDANAAADEQIAKEGLNQEKKGKEPSEEAYDAVKMSIDVAEDNAISTYNKVLNKRYAALNDEYNEQTDAMKYIFMSKHPNFKAYKELESEYTNYGKKIKELKEKLVSADGYDAKQTILKQIRAEREKFSGLQSKVR